MNIAKHYVWIAIAGLALFLNACSTATDPSEAYKGETAQQIFSKGEDALRSRSYQQAIKRFEALDVQYPFGHETEIAQLHLIYAYYMTDDYASAESAADRYIHAHPISDHVDYAYMMRGLSNYYQNLGIFEHIFAIDLATRDLTQIKKSYNDFAMLVRNYPHSQYAPAAHQYMIYLRNTLADHELEVAKYYYSRGAYIAAADRANLVVRHYQGAPAIPEALAIMSKSYGALGLAKNQQEVQQVIEFNYPSAVKGKS
ncbi:MAG: outer membrane protein assembly factor BamD [Gammaproteobacteria bacterium]|nr:outer membrane protein assembly factor BamD [Gammaproteobacteria bacterium]